MAMTSKKSILLAGASFVAAAFVIASTTRSADAAITVIGSGPAQLCYEGAENGGDAGEYVAYCNQALNTVLSVRDRAATFINRGVLRLTLNEVNAALSDFDSGLGLDPALGEGYVDRGASLIEKKEYAEALESIDKGLSLGARRPALAYFDRAIANEGLGNIPAAYKDYQQALVVQPGFTMASDELKRFKVVRKTTGS
jgi:tetratricopeptide (TPR) repeat protein